MIGLFFRMWRGGLLSEVMETGGAGCGGNIWSGKVDIAGWDVKQLNAFVGSKED